MPAQASERFHITATDYTRLLLLPSLLTVFNTSAPNCSAEFVTINLRDMEHVLEAGDVDLALAFHTDLPSSLRRSLLFSDTYVCIVRKDHPVDERSLTPEAFATMPQVSVSPSGLSYFARVVDSALDSLGSVVAKQRQDGPYLMRLQVTAQLEPTLNARSNISVASFQKQCCAPVFAQWPA